MFITMVTTYTVNTKELENNFIKSVRTTYPNQVVEIQVKEQDATEYLLSSPANREHLENAVKNVEQGKIKSFETLENAIQLAQEQNAKK